MASGGNLQDQLRRKMERLKADVVKVLNRGYRRFETKMIKEHLSGPTGPTSVRSHRGSAGLRGSLGKEGPQFLGTQILIRAFIGRGSMQLKKQARAHEFGATIMGKPWLKIPLRRTKGGDVQAKFMGRISDKDRYWVKSKAGNPVLIQKSSGLPILVLVRKVYLPPRLNFRNEWKAASRQIKIELREIANRIMGTGGTGFEKGGAKGRRP